MLRLILSVFALLTLLTPVAEANPTRVEAVEAELIVDSTAIEAGKPFWAALVLRMDHKWHTYWINPGDSGYAAQVDWKMPDGFIADAFKWPTPMRLPTPPLMSYGYEDEVVLPVQITPPAGLQTGQTYSIGGEVHWLMCKDICLPGDAPLYVDVQAADVRTPHPVHDVVIQTTLARLPDNPLGLEAEVTYSDNHVSLSVTAPNEDVFPTGDFVFIPATEGVIEDSKPQQVIAQDNTLTVRMDRDTFNLTAPNPLEGLLVSDNGLTVAKLSAAQAAAAGNTADTAAASNLPANLFIALVMAFIGGLILNLMPCVLPVLSIKVLHVVNHSKKQDAWKHGVAFTLGVTSTFMLLVGVLEVLKAGGSHIGWGFQLQSPVFVSLLAVILTAIALDLFGVFEIGTSLTRLGSAFDDRKGHVGSFLTGILATVVATPCTAPFMGSAIAYSLGQPTLVTLAIFLTLGFGLSAPYMVLTAFPKLLRFVPKPGAWMETFKQLLAFPVLATVVWLGWVLSLQAGQTGIAILLLTLLGLGFGLWLYGKAQYRGAGLISALIILALTIGAVTYGIGQINKLEPVSAATQTTDGWKPYSREQLNKLNRLRRPVLVVYTAAWCITCKVNEKLVLKAPDTLKLFEDNSVEVLVADWTNRNAAIADDLARFGRSGVPFYVYYPPQGKPVPLPEVISYSLLKEVIEAE